MTKLRYAVSIVSLLALAATSVWAEGAGGAPPAEGTPEALAIATLTKAFTAFGKSDVPTLEQCLAPRLMGIALDPDTGAPTQIIMQRDDICKALQQGGAAAANNPLAAFKIVEPTAQAGPGDLVLVTYKMSTGDANAKPLGPFWAMVGKTQGQWRIFSFTVPMPAPEE
jgi:hypothetical protein